MSRKVGFEPVTFGTAARHPTADLGNNLGDIGNQRTILLPITYDPTEWKRHLDRGSNQILVGRSLVQANDGNHRAEKYGRRRGFLCII